MDTEKHKLGHDGMLEDGVSYYPADIHDLATFDIAKQALSQMRAPVLHHVDNRMNACSWQRLTALVMMLTRIPGI